MIDLRSDTLTKPSLEMKQAMYHAKLGDDGRSGSTGRSEDPTVRKLEDLAANLTRHEAALFCNSGTMANYIAVLTHGLQRGDKILTDRLSHIYRSEKALFTNNLVGIEPRFYPLDKDGAPDIKTIENHLIDKDIDLITIENTHNSNGGTCISVEHMKNLSDLAKDYEVPLHLDGARIFNAAVYFDINVDQLTSPADSVMFCLSKGLGAPIGSMLCGTHDFIQEARKMRKILGGSLRQAGVIAAAGIVALEEGFERLKTDHEITTYLAKEINNKYLKVNLRTVQTNIINADVSASSNSAFQIKKELEQSGLKLNAISETKIRLVIHKDISKAEISEAAEILNNHFDNQ